MWRTGLAALFVFVAASAPRASIAAPSSSAKCAVVGIVSRGEYVKKNERICFSLARDARRKQYTPFREDGTTASSTPLSAAVGHNPRVCPIVGIRSLHEYLTRRERWCFRSERAAVAAGFAPLGGPSTVSVTPTATPSPVVPTPASPTPGVPPGAITVAASLKPVPPQGASYQPGSCTGYVDNTTLHLHCVYDVPEATDLFIHINDRQNAEVCHLPSPPANPDMVCALSPEALAALDNQILMLYVHGTANTGNTGGADLLSGPVLRRQ